MSRDGGTGRRPPRAASHHGPRGTRSEHLRCILRFFVIVAALSALMTAGKLFAGWVGLPELDEKTEIAIHFALIAFVLAAAIPFVPGAEIGLALLMILGSDAALEVYFAMLIALLMAFTTGRLLPARIVTGLRARAESHWRLFRLRASSARRWTSLAVARRAFNFLAMNRLDPWGHSEHAWKLNLGRRRWYFVHDRRCGQRRADPG